MSKKLDDFIEILSSDMTSRDDVEIGTFVTWLRRRINILRNMDTRTLTSYAILTSWT